MPPATHPPLPNRKPLVPEPTLLLDGRLSERVKGIRTPLTSVCPGPFKLWGGEGRGGRGDLNGGPGDRAEGGPTRDQRPRKKQRVWGCPFTHGCSAKSSPTTSSSGPSGEGGPTSGSVPLAQLDS